MVGIPEDMQKFAAQEQTERVQAAVKRAKKWIESTAPKTHEDLNSRLGGLALVRGDRAAIDATLQDVLKAQRADGGWSNLA